MAPHSSSKDTTGEGRATDRHRDGTDSSSHRQSCTRDNEAVVVAFALGCARRWLVVVAWMLSSKMRSSPSGGNCLDYEKLVADTGVFSNNILTCFRGFMHSAGGKRTWLCGIQIHEQIINKERTFKSVT